MNFNDYLEISGQAMRQAAYVYDHARAAERLTSFSLIDENEGPYLASNDVDLKKLVPLYLRTSIEMQAAFNISATGRYECAPDAKDGKILIEMSLLPTLEGSRVTPFIAKTSIVEQFELLKKYLIVIGAPYNEKRIKAKRGIVRDEVLDRISYLASRRNALAHDIDAPHASMKNAVEYYYKCIIVAKFFRENGA